jgi:hypothetical protein
LKNVLFKEKSVIRAFLVLRMGKNIPDIIRIPAFSRGSEDRFQPPPAAKHAAFQRVFSPGKTYDPAISIRFTA